MSRTAIATWFSRPIMLGSPCTRRLRRQLYCQDVNKTQGFLAPMGGDGGAYRAFERLLDRGRIAPARPRQLLERIDHGVIGDAAHVRALAIGLGNADQVDLR